MFRETQKSLGIFPDDFKIAEKDTKIESRQKILKRLKSNKFK